MKILVVCQYYYPEPFRITDICETLVLKGHKITVLTGLPNYPEGSVLEGYRKGRNRKEIINGVQVIRCFEIGRGKTRTRLLLNYISFPISASLKILSLGSGFDVVLLNQLSPILMGIPAILYKMKYRKRILLYCLDLWPASLESANIKESTIVYNIFLKISKWIYKSADIILVASSMFIDYFEATLKIKAHNIKYLPQYADDLYLKHKNNYLQQDFNAIDINKHNFVFAGNIGEMQSVETIIKAANELKTNKDIVFHILGEGSKLNKCKTICSELKLENIIFYGRLPITEMPKFYKAAEAMLITLNENQNISYTLPGKVQSYLAAGKPIIGSINGETKRVIEEAKCGYCCNAEDYKELAKLVLKFTKSKDKETMANNSYDYYVKNYTKERFMLSLDETLKKMED